jgi:hypothetical protein
VGHGVFACMPPEVGVFDRGGFFMRDNTLDAWQHA